MKKKLFFIPVFFAITLLLAITVQSFHGYEHLKAQVELKKCAHDSYTKADITHQHKVPEHCLVCTFSFGTFITTPLFSLPTQQLSVKVPYSFIVKETSYSFSGSLYSHRGPPQTIV